MEKSISTEQYQAFMFAYEQVGGVKYIYTSHIPTIYSILIRYGFPDNEETIEGLRKAIALKFFGDVYVAESDEKIGAFLKGFSFKAVKVNNNYNNDPLFKQIIQYCWSEGYVDSNKILRCHLLHTQNHQFSSLYED